MRLNKGTIIILFVLVVIIVAAVLLLQQEPDDTEATDATPANVLLFEGIEAETVTALSFTIDNGMDTSTPTVNTRFGVVTLALEKDESGNWIVGEGTTNPPTESIDETIINQRLDSLLTMRYRDRFESDDLAPYGLDETQDEINFTAGDTSYRLRIGDVNISGTQYYALLGEDEATVYLLTSKTTVDNLLDLANNQPIIPDPTPTPVPILALPGPVFSNFDQTGVQALTITNHATEDEITYILNEETREWRVDNLQDSVDQTVLTVSIADFGALRAVDGLPGDNLEPLGLLEPAYTITAQLGEDQHLSLQIGGLDVTETRYYTLVNDFDEVAVIAVEDIGPLLSLLEEPPLLPEVEATVEATAEVTEEAEGSG